MKRMQSQSAWGAHARNRWALRTENSAERQRSDERRALVIHAAWSPRDAAPGGQMAIWAEAEMPAPKRRPRLTSTADPRHPRTHPFAARHGELMGALEALWRVSRPGVRPRTGHSAARLGLWLPAMGTRPLPSPELVGAGWAQDPAILDGAPTTGTLALWRADALLLDAEAACVLLAGLPQTQDTGRSALATRPRMLLGSDVRFWSAAARFALHLLVRQRYLPGALELPAREPDSFGYGNAGVRVASHWTPYFNETDDHTRFAILAAAMPQICRAAVPAGQREQLPETAVSPTVLLENFLSATLSGCIQRWLGQEQVSLRLPTGNRYSYGTGAYRYEYYSQYYGSLASRWLAGLATPDRPLYTSAAEAIALLDGIERWHSRLSHDERMPFRLCFRLSPPEMSDETDGAGDAILDSGEALDNAVLLRTSSEHGNGSGGDARTENARLPHLVVGADVEANDRHNRAGSNGYGTETKGDLNHQRPELDAVSLLGDLGPWRLDYLLQARDDPSLLVSLETVWNGASEAAQFLDRRFAHPHERILSALGQAARVFAPIERSLHTLEPSGCELTGAEAYAFLRDAVPLLEENDYGVLVPAWWKRATPKPTMRLRMHGAAAEGSGLLGLDAVVSYDWKMALGGVELSREELERLATLKEPLVRLRGQWVELRPKDIADALRVAHSHRSGRMSLGEALRAALAGEIGEGDVAIEEVRADSWIGDLLARFRSGAALTEVPPPPGLRGTLRPYQLRGLSWLNFLTQYGLGACLADDMGLGKTVELLSLLLHRKAEGALSRPVLLVCPTSVVGNWQHEAARFAPDLDVLVHHGAGRVGRSDAEAFAAEAAQANLVVTTYSLLPRDARALESVEWAGVVLDEAQNIKNVETKQSRAVRRLNAPVRVALTGTPVENRLSELWSILDFLNPGYLGSQARFAQRFVYPIEKLRDPEATARLQSLVQPFVLRRLKTDASIIQDLPEKLEMREYCPLTREQVSLYEAVVRDGLRELEESEGMRRRAVILGMLTKLKQVCNHPAHLLGDGSALAGRSGKLTRLEELIEELLSEGDRALVFTQFTAMGDRLQPYLQERFGVETLYMHGGVPRTRRERMIERFQAEDGPPLFLLSLKAGGLGLNLTRANHVIHFDRWWNPAVENQATDRAFRIGQTRNVQVRKFVCTGTLEERIDALIERKRELAENVVGTGEGWITEMSTEQLRDLFSLRAVALAD